MNQTPLNAIRGVLVASSANLSARSNILFPVQGVAERLPRHYGRSSELATGARVGVDGGDHEIIVAAE